MRHFTNTQAIFQQLATTDGLAVKSVIENHDAWFHNDDIQRVLNATLRLQLARSLRDPPVAARIRRQRETLSTLVTRLPMRISSAG